MATLLLRMATCWVVRESLCLNEQSDTGLENGEGVSRRSLVMGGSRTGFRRRRPLRNNGTEGNVNRSGVEYVWWPGNGVVRRETIRLVSFVFFNVLLLWLVLTTGMDDSEGAILDGAFLWDSWSTYEVVAMWSGWFFVLALMRLAASVGPAVLETVLGLHVQTRERLLRKGVRSAVCASAVFVFNLNLYNFALRPIERQLLYSCRSVIALEIMFKLRAFNITVETVERVSRFLLQHPAVELDQKWDTSGTYVFYVRNLSSHVHLAVQVGHILCLWWLKGFQCDVIDLMLVFSIHENLNALRKCYGALSMFEFQRANLLKVCDEVPSPSLKETKGLSDCAICWDDLESHIIRLPCGHHFHRGCAIRWLRRCRAHSSQPSCPLCRTVCT